MSNEILIVDRLSKTFRSHWAFRRIEALREVSFSLAEGETYGYLGHNGAGKTTTIKSILGLVSPSSGKVLFQGREMRRAADRKAIGYLSEIPYFYDHLTVSETLTFFARLYGVSSSELSQRVREVVALVGLEEKRLSRVRTLSKGLQQRLGFAQAIIGRPALLLLDEPFSGLDPLARIEFRNLILELKRSGTTILLSSHILSDVEYICDRVAIMAKGEMKLSFALADSGKLYGEKHELVVRASDNEELRAKLAANSILPSPAMASREGLWEYTYQTEAQALTALREALTSGAEVREYRAMSPRLEDIFVATTAALVEAKQ